MRDQHKPPPYPPPNQDTPELHVDIKKIPNVKCEKCGGETYFNVFRFKIVPSVQSKTGREDPFASSTWICTNCRKENQKLRAAFREVTKILLEQLGTKNPL